MKSLQTTILSFILLISQSLWAAPSVSVVFVMDESTSISNSNFRLETDGFRNALNSIPADGSVEISVVDFSSSSSTIVSPTILTAASLETIRDALLHNRQALGGTNMGSALTNASNLLNQSSAPTKVICLSTDGRPSIYRLPPDARAEEEARLAANQAKSAGIIISPIAIGLTAAGRTFLDGIASNPPVPDPGTFGLFGSVVENTCIGEIQRNIGMTLSPNPVNYGSYTSASIISANETREVILSNNSTQTLTIENLSITGQDAEHFKIVGGDSDGQTVLPQFITPFLIAPKSRLIVFVSMNPSQSPADGSLDALLAVQGKDSKGKTVYVSASLKATIDPVSMKVDIIDAHADGALITEVQDEILGNYKKDGQPLFERDVNSFSKVQSYRRVGFVADGNSRLLIRVQTNTPGSVEFTIPSNIKASLEKLDRQDPSQTTIEIPTVLVNAEDDIYQATAVLVAPERFPGQKSEPNITFNLFIGIKNNSGRYENIQRENILVKRAPVVLIHGLWASDKSWTGETWYSSDIDTSAMQHQLITSFFNVGLFHYDNWKGPEDTMQQENIDLFNKIESTCQTEREQGITCTRSDLVGHSMGGLVARKYIKDNSNYLQASNYLKGNVRRLITIGTPHTGSGFATLLATMSDYRNFSKHNTNIGNCVDTLAKKISVSNHIQFLYDIGKKTGSAIVDLSYGSKLIADLNKPAYDSRRIVPAFPIIGNTGNKNLEWDIDNKIAGCTHHELFHGDNSDTYVSVSSATGKLDNGRVILEGVQHVGMGTNKRIIDNTISILNGKLDSYTQLAKNISDNEMHKASTDKTQNSKQTIFTKVKKTLNAAQIVMFGFIGISNAFAEEFPSISLSLNKETPSSGETIEFTANITGQNISTVVLTDGKSFDKADNTSPYAWTFNLPITASGQRTFKVVAIINHQTVESNTITVTVKPDLSSLKELTFEPGESVILFPGMSERLHLLGLFNDGQKRVLSQSAMETIYSENIVNGLTVTAGNSPVISISPDGELVAEKPGVAEVVATNNGKSTVRRIKVLSVKPDDADGDGLTDSVEHTIHTNPFHPDSDGDGVNDHLEIGNNASSPLDSNNDGLIDALDANVIAFKDESGGFVSISASAGTLVSPNGKKLTDYPNREANLATYDVLRELLSFGIEDLIAGQSIDVTLSFDSLPNGIDKFLMNGLKLPDGVNAKWYEFTNFDVNDNKVILHLTDNELGDTNPIKGVITGLGGVASSGQGGTSSSGGGGSLNNQMLFLLLTLVVIRFYISRRYKT